MVCLDHFSDFCIQCFVVRQRFTPKFCNRGQPLSIAIPCKYGWKVGKLLIIFAYKYVPVFIRVAPNTVPPPGRNWLPNMRPDLCARSKHISDYFSADRLLTNKCVSSNKTAMYIHCVSNKFTLFIFVITRSNVDRF